MADFTPTSEQRVALEHPAPLLVLAGAGTGKTTVLTRRIARAIEGGAARPSQVLALTFTDKAAAEMRERLRDLLGEAALDVTARTFHSFGGQVIRENLLRLGFDRPPGVVSGAASWQLLSSFFGELSFDGVDLAVGQLSAVFDHLLHFFAQAKDHLVSPEDLDTYLAGFDLAGWPAALAAHLEPRLAQLCDVAAAYRRYEQAKRERGLIDFGDHLYLAARLLRDEPAVGRHYRERYRFLFVDEYQDTNHAQRLLLLHLIDPARPEVMVIGDDDQAIYRWRGAVVHNILRFPEEEVFARGGAKRVPMTLNRRSAPPILDLANLAIAGVRERHAKQLTYHEANSHRRALVGHYVAASDRGEGRWIAGRIRELEPEARGLPGKKRGYGAFAVLCRKRSLLAPVGDALDQAGIPYELVGGAGFYGRWEVRDILSYLRVLGQRDDLALARILRSRRFRLAGADLFHLGKWVDQQNGGRGRHGEEKPKGARLHLHDAVRRGAEVEGLSPEAVGRLSRLARELDEYMVYARDHGAAELVARVIEGTGYRRELEARAGFDARAALLNLAKLEEMAEAFAATTEGADLGAFVEYVGYAVDAGDEEAELKPVDEESDRVKVMTIHQAKGLEFPIVFLPGLAERVFPTPGKDEADQWYELPWDLRGDREHLPVPDLTGVRTEAELKRVLEERKRAERENRFDEERRLFYVAITRAERQLYLSRAHWYGGNVKPREASPFWQLVVDSGLADDLGGEDPPETNPNLAREAAAEEAEQAGEREAVALLLAGADPAGWIETLVRREGYGRWAVPRADTDEHLERLAAARARTVDEGGADVTVTGLALYLDCPRLYRYRYVDRLPSPPWPMGALGREVHRRIEELSRPPAPASIGRYAGEEPPEPDEEANEETEELASPAAPAAGEGNEPGLSVEDLVDRFRRSVYGRRPATYVEYPLYVPLAGGALRGRADRVDRLADGRWAVIDFKSGRRSIAMKTTYRRQLALYALAVSEAWQLPADRVEAHLFFLRDGEDLAWRFDRAELGRTRAEAEAAMRAIAGGEYPACRDPDLCADCVYAHLCADGGE